MKLRELIQEDITSIELDQIEAFADKIFSKVGIDVKFTRHFLDRVNDKRNGKPISVAELIRIYRKEALKWGRPIAQMGDQEQALLKDLGTDINIPVVLSLDPRSGQPQLVAKTVMRKKDFRSPNRAFPVESTETQENGTYAAFYISEESGNQIKEWCNQNNIDSNKEPTEYHCTLIYSQTPVPELNEFNGIEVNVSAKIISWDILGTALVWRLDCPEAEIINRKMTKAGASSDFDTYVAHTTIITNYEGEIPSILPEFEITFSSVLVEDLESENLDSPTPTPKELSLKHNVPLDRILRQLNKGIHIEKEHTGDIELAREIALDHLSEYSDYYDRLEKIER